MGRSFPLLPVVVVVDVVRCRCMCIQTLLGCLVFGYFEAHIGRSFEHKLNAEGARRKIIFMCAWHPRHLTPSTFQSSLKFSAAFKQCERKTAPFLTTTTLYMCRTKQASAICEKQVDGPARS